MNSVDPKDAFKGRALLVTALAAGGLALFFVLRANGARDTVPEVVASETPPPAASDAAPPPRCTRDPKTAPLGEGLARGDLLLGEAAATRDGYAIGLVRTVQNARRASVALLPHDLQNTTFVDLAANAGDFPPPRPFVLRGELFAASYAQSLDGGPPLAAADSQRAAKLGTRSLHIARIDAGGKASPFAEVPQQADESLAFDVVTAADGRALITWDEDAPGNVPANGEMAGRGIIRAAAIPAQGGGITASSIISSEGSDVERPQGIARPGGGFWIGWIARRTDPHAEKDPKAIEQNGEDRGFAWVEIARVDDEGKRTGEVHRITSDSGHVTAFDWLARPDGKLDIFVRDDAEASHEGEGGRILRIPVRDEGPEQAQSVVKTGAGPGDPSAVGTPAMGNIGQGWLFYADTGEHAHAVSLADASDTLEPALDGQTVLLAGPEREGTLVLAVGPETRPVSDGAEGDRPQTRGRGAEGDRPQTRGRGGPAEQRGEQAEAATVRCNAAARH